MYRIVGQILLFLVLCSCGTQKESQTEYDFEQHLEMQFRYTALMQQAGMDAGHCQSGQSTGGVQLVLVCIIDRSGESLYLVASETTTALRVGVALINEKRLLKDGIQNVFDAIEDYRGFVVKCTSFVDCQDQLVKQLPKILNSVRI